MKQPQKAQIQHFRSNTVNVNGTRIHYWTGGDPHGQPVLLWHGFLGTAHSWHKVMPLLADAGYSVLVPDMRGYGDSDKPAGTEGYDARSLADEFRALVKLIGFGEGRKLLVVGHDMGAHPAMIWAADHPEEIVGLVYMEVPTMLEEFLTKLIVYTPQAAAEGSMWWWLLPLAPGVSERLIVGHERAFLTWFYERSTATPGSVSDASIEETLRTFSGTDGVLGATGVYRAAFRTIEQTTPLVRKKLSVPVLAVGGEKALGSRVGDMVGAVANSVTVATIRDCGHFIPEEKPDELVAMLHTFANEVNR